MLHTRIILSCLLFCIDENKQSPSVSYYINWNNSNNNKQKKKKKKKKKQKQKKQKKKKKKKKKKETESLLDHESCSD